MFSLVNAVLLRPLRYKNPDQLVRLYTEFPTFPNGGLRRFWMSAPEWDELAHDLHSFSAIEAWASGGVNLSASKEPLRINATNVTGGMFDLLGVPPMLGRTINKADDVKGALPVAVISYGFFQREFAGDRSVLNRVLKVDGLDTNIVGVMPPDFGFPPGELEPSDAWFPMQLGPDLMRRRAGHFLNVVGRLRPGVSLGMAQAEIASHVEASPARESVHPFSPKAHPIVAYPLREETVRNARPALWTLLAAVYFVLLIACVNVANLMLARAEARQAEIAVRRALGAGTPQLVRQFAMEGLFLSLAGGVLGLTLAVALVRTVARLGAASIPRADEIGVDFTVSAVTLVVLVLTTLVFALAPLVQLSGQRVYDALKSASARVSGTAVSNRFRSILVTGELALALVLLIATGLMLRTFWNLDEVQLGYRPEQLLTARLELPNEVYKSTQDMQRFWQAAQERIARIPGVLQSTLAAGLPPERPINANDTFIEGFTPVPGGPGHNIDFWQIAGEHFFETLGARLVEGRFFDQGDLSDKNPVVIINQTMARTYYGNQSPIGHRVRIGNDKSPWLTIVGVVGDLKNAALDRPAGTELFLPYHQLENVRRNHYVILRASGDSSALAASLRRAIQEIDPQLPLAQVRTMTEVLSGAKSRPRFLATLLGAFSAAALLLSAVGLYGVIAYAVTRRTSEFGIRMAIGATASQILRLVLQHGLKLSLAGIACGAVGAIALTRLMQGLLYGVSSFDPATLVVTSAVLLAVTLLACMIPARRATRSDPMTALRYD